jgi:1-deoxy-D-xylulose-5-phosphate reductoisomerase
LIEACHLFGARSEQVQVVVHPQSIVHSLVSYRDGSVLAQLGNPDMRTPIAHALAWPQRLSSGVPPVDLVAIGRLDFEPPDLRRFPCLALGRMAAEAGGTTTAILNGANEVAVSAFLDGRIIFTDIAGVIEDTLANVAALPGETLDEVLESDQLARATADVSVTRRNRQVRG